MNELSNFFKNTFFYKNNIYSTKEIIKNTNAIKYNKISPNKLYSRSKLEFTNSNFDFESTKNFLSKYIPKKTEFTILDIGSGDGRFTSWILKNSKLNVIAVDCNYYSLNKIRLRERRYIKNKRLILICSDIENLKFRNNVFDYVLNFESLYYLDKSYFKILSKINRSIKIHGKLITVERHLFGGCVHSLINGDLTSMINVYKNKKIYDYFEKLKVDTISIDSKKLISFMNRFYFKLISKKNISILPMIITYILSRDSRMISVLRKNKKKIFNFLNNHNFSDDSSRLGIYIFRKFK